MSLGKGVIRDYDAVTGLATVEIVGGHAYYVQVPAATHLSAVQLVDGRRCAVLFFDEQNPRDGVVVAAYDVVAAGPNVHAANHAAGGADELDAADLGSGAADAGDVLQADGSGGAAWAAPAAGGVGVLLDTATDGANDVVTLSTTSWTNLGACSVTVTLGVAGVVLLVATVTAKGSGAGAGVGIQWYEGATALNEQQRITDASYESATLVALVSAAAGEHTYNVKWTSTSGTASAIYRRVVAAAFAAAA